MADFARSDLECDVLVVGGGGSGLMAAVEAAEAGARVILAEKLSGLGGATGMAVGSISASGTALQAAAGIRDNADSHFNDLLKFIPPPSSPNDYNLALSQGRADEVRNYLIQKGLEEFRVEANGYGETVPEVPNDSDDNRQINRRVEFKVTKT